MVACNHHQNTNSIACDLELSQKMMNYFKKCRDVSVSLVTLPCKQ
jgi:hypothetical protein